MNSLNCLILEDSIVQSKIIERMVSSCGWNVQKASSLEEAIKILEHNQFDLIIADMVLPDSEDCDVIEAINQAARSKIIVAMSACDDVNKSSSILFKAKEQGAAFLLTKPFRVERIKGLLCEIEYRLETGERLPHVLVVDDSRSVCKICENLLTEIGYRVTLSETMDEALQSVDLLDVDIILTDLNMPGLEPRIAIPYIRNSIPGVGIVAMSGNIDQHLENTLENGADAILAKPFVLTKFVEALDTAFERRASL